MAITPNTINPEQTRPVADKQLPLSVVIPCKNESGYIGKLLDSLVAQTYDLSGTPIYIADAGSTDGTIELIENFKTGSGLDIQIINGGYPSAARNSGAAQSMSRYILFLDADIYLDESDFIECVMKSAVAMDLDCVGTLVRCDQPGWKDKLIWNSLTLFMYAYPWMKPFSTGMCIFMKRSAFEAIGGFDESIYLGEDVELTSQIDRNKFGIVKRHVVTTNRRFEQMGYVRTMGMYTQLHFSKKYRHRDHRAYFGS